MRYVEPTTGAPECFFEGADSRAYEWLGAHRVLSGDNAAWRFTLYAPNARAVYVIGDFNEWNTESDPMISERDGVWTLDVPCESIASPRYQYAILGQDGVLRSKLDPYGFACGLRPDSVSLMTELDGYVWRDDVWMASRERFSPRESPVSIYEVHLGSWQRGEDGSFLSYSELAQRLIPYVKDMGYTHIELMPVLEHPLDGSWGYQVTGFFAPTSRFGSFEGLMELIDSCHIAGLGVILDLPLAHFPRDEAGLDMLDGTALYSSADPRRADMPLWGTKLFDLGRGEVSSFLISCASFWLSEYHFDGLRIDAVSCMLYHDFCKGHGQYLPNIHGGRENIEAIRFLRRLNDDIASRFPGVMTFAEESSDFPIVTRPTYLGGLGFTFKWNMGWTSDTLSFISADYDARRRMHDKLTLPVMYSFRESHLLALSHDEAVYGKRSYLEKNHGDSWQKFAGLRALLGYTFAFPGKKLMFMGAEIGQSAEWDYGGSLDWSASESDRRPKLRECVRALNRIYRQTPALYENDCSWDGFRWLISDDIENAAVAFLRIPKYGDALICAVSFTPVFHPIYRIGLPYEGTVNEVFNSDRAEFGGSNQYNAYELTAREGGGGELPYWVEICMPPLGCVFLSYRIRRPAPKKRAHIKRLARATAHRNRRYSRINHIKEG